MTLLSAIAWQRNAAWPRRETAVLAVAGLAVAAYALAYAGSGNREAIPSSPSEPKQIWTGQLASVAPVESSPQNPLSTASLLVPKDQLALPAAPPKPKPVVRNVCDSADLDCIPRSALVANAANPPRRSALAAVEDKVTLAGVTTPRPPGLIPTPAAHPRPAKAAAHPKPENNSLLANLGRPFAAIGRTVKGWMNL